MTKRFRLVISIISISTLAVLVLWVGFLTRQEKIRVEGPRKRDMDASSTPTLEQHLKMHERENRDLKERSWSVSPSGKKTGHFQHKLITDLSEIENDDYKQLVVEENSRPETVFAGNFRVSSFEWLSDTEIAVYQDCGTECMIAYYIDLTTKHKHRFFLGVGYTWSPDRQYVLAYHINLQQGISVGDKFGNQIFTLRRDSPSTSENYSSHRASWSPDSSRLALIIHKEDKTKLELLVFAVKQNFKIILQQDLAGDSLTNLGWSDQLTIFYTMNEETKKISLR